MRYFIDTEFIEGTQDKTFCGIKIGETKPTIDLISIGIVSEVKKIPDNIKQIGLQNGIFTLSEVIKGNTSKEYYAISKEFNLKEAWNRYDKVVNKQYPMGPKYNKVYWIRDNVLRPVYYELCQLDNPNLVVDGYNFNFSYKEFKRLLNKYGKTNKQIAEEVLYFCSNGYFDKTGFDLEQAKQYDLYDKFKPEFYGYYCDYDWVVFCWLFGKMINLPAGFPMYCIDLKQELDRIAEIKSNEWGTIRNGVNVFDMQNHIKTLPDYPKQTNEHSAIHDAKYNYELYKFLQTL